MRTEVADSLCAGEKASTSGWLCRRILMPDLLRKKNGGERMRVNWEEDEEKVKWENGKDGMEQPWCSMVAMLSYRPCLSSSNVFEY